MMAAFAGFERSMIKERQREGIQAAKETGKQIGANPKLDRAQVREFRKRVNRVKAKLH